MGVSRKVRLWSVLGAALLLVSSSAFSAFAGSAKKKYTADVSPHSVNTSSTVTYTLAVTNKALTQNLGSCNLTAPGGFTLGTVTVQPATGTATKVGNTLQLRNLATLPMTSRSVSFTATAPGSAGLYSWSIVCRQSNNFNPDTESNEFVLDAANSNLKTTVVAPLPSADIAVTSNSDSQDPVTASNTVVYTVTVANNGPATSGPLTLTDSLPNGGSFSSIGGTNWTCSGSGSSQTCTHAALASGASAETVTAYVLTPDADTTITNRAAIAQSGANDPNPGNNTLDQDTTVQANTTCESGMVSCGSGTVTYSQPSQVRSCQTPSILVYICGLVTFNPVSAEGGQIYSLSSPQTPENLCPISLTNSTLVQCDWQVNLDPIPSVFPTGSTTGVFTCHQSKCPSGLGDLGTIVIYVGENGQREIMSRCSGPGDTSRCFERSRVGGNLVITVRNMPPGDPKIAGRCVGGC
jgi:uncharacterized repeat protein (TIGR01451 family)